MVAHWKRATTIGVQGCYALRLANPPKSNSQLGSANMFDRRGERSLRRRHFLLYRPTRPEGFVHRQHVDAHSNQHQDHGPEFPIVMDFLSAVGSMVIVLVMFVVGLLRHVGPRLSDDWRYLALPKHSIRRPVRNGR